MILENDFMSIMFIVSTFCKIWTIGLFICYAFNMPRNVEEKQSYDYLNKKLQETLQNAANGRSSKDDKKDKFRKEVQKWIMRLCMLMLTLTFFDWLVLVDHFGPTPPEPTPPEPAPSESDYYE